MAGHALAPSPRDGGACHLLRTASGSVLLAAVGGGAEGVPAHRATAWAAALFAAVAPRRVVALAPLPAGGAPGGGAVLAALQTAAAAAAGASAAPPAAPLLPPGPLLGGAPAAVLAHVRAPMRLLTISFLVALYSANAFPI